MLTRILTLSSCPLFVIIFSSFSSWMFSSTTCLMMKPRHSHVFGCRFDWFAEVVVNLDRHEKFGGSFLRTIRMKLPSCHRLVIIIRHIQLFSTPLHWSQTELHSMRNLRIGTFVINAWWHSLSFPRFWGGLNCVIVMFSLLTVSSGRNLWEIKCMRKINNLK